MDKIVNKKFSSLKRILNLSKKSIEIRFDELNEFLEFIDNSINQECEKIEGRYKKILNRLSLKNKEDEDAFSWFSDAYADDYQQINKVFKNMLYYSYVVTLHGFIETQLNNVCDVIKNNLDNIELRVTDLKGDILERTQKYFKKVVKIQFPGNGSEWQAIQTLNKTRNAIVHCEGYIGKDTKDGKYICEYIKQHPEYIGLSERKQMMLTQKYSLFITEQSKQFFEQFFRSLLCRE